MGRFDAPWVPGNFFDHLRALTTFLYFTGWDEMIAFMAQKLELDTS